MKVVGIVAEYNPFHNGHKYQLDYAKNVLGADYVIVAMSGSFTQRGSIASFDKYSRAKAALLNGADLVFEIPTIFATSSAREFAAAGVSLLQATGVVDTLLFGAETDDINGFKENVIKCIDLEKSEVFDNYISDKLSEGIPFAVARADFLKSHIDTDFISSSNNILGSEYIRYIIEKNIALEPVCLKREGNSYTDSALSGSLSSASAIRNALSSVTDISLQVPENCLDIFSKNCFINEDDISPLLHYKLLSENDFSSYLDCSADLSDRIVKLRNDFISYSQFADLLKTKNLSYSHISRALCHILLGIKDIDFEKEKSLGYVQDLRLLGFSQNGSSLLKDINEKSRLKMITVPDKELNKFDIISSDLLRLVLTSKTNKCFKNEFTRKFDLINI